MGAAEEKGRSRYLGCRVIRPIPRVWPSQSDGGSGQPSSETEFAGDSAC
jgi:hypothetical protein